MRKILSLVGKAILHLVPIGLSILALLLTYEPREVKTKLSQWIEEIGYRAPPWSQMPWIDEAAPWVFGTLAACGFLWIGWSWFHGRYRGINRFKTAGTPKGRITVCDVVQYIAYESKFGDERSLNEMSDDVTREIQQAAFEGHAQIWGTIVEKIDRGQSRLEVPIRPEYWERHEIDLGPTLMSSEVNGGVTKQRGFSLEDPVTFLYDSLQMDKDQVRRNWPERSIFKFRARRPNRLANLITTEYP